MPNDTAIVLEVIAGGPAEKAGMLPGDRLLKVDDKVIAGVKFPQDSMVRRMKGPSGTKVLVTVGRGADVIPFEIVRGKIPLHSIDAAFMVDDTTGYVRLAKFSSATRKDFVEAYTSLLEQGMKHLMMDLRDNSGGFLDQALLLSNEFLSRGDTIVYMEGLHRPREVFRADGHGKLKDIGLTVLISENSASSTRTTTAAPSSAAVPSARASCRSSSPSRTNPACGSPWRGSTRRPAAASRSRMTTTSTTSTTGTPAARSSPPTA